mgnify:CR=1 FL=1
MQVLHLQIGGRLQGPHRPYVDLQRPSGTRPPAQGRLLVEEQVVTHPLARGQDQVVLPILLFSRVRASDIAMMTRQLSTLVGAGFPLVANEIIKAIDMNKHEEENEK